MDAKTSAAIWKDAYDEWSRSENDARRSGRSESESAMSFMKMLAVQIYWLKPRRNHAIADVGCGNGMFATVWAQMVKHLTLFDNVRQQLEHASEAVNYSGCEHALFIELDIAMTMNIYPRPHNGVIVNGVLQSIPPDRLDFVIGNLKSMTKPGGGRVFLQGIPQGSKLAPVLARKIEEAAAAGRTKTIELYQSLVMYDPRALRDRFNAAGFTPTIIDPPPWDPHHEEGFHLLAVRR